MKGLVTGASGFIGKNFILNTTKNIEIVAIYNQSTDFLQFIERNNLKHVVPVQCNLLSEKEIIKNISHRYNKFDFCLYLAANGDPSISVKNPVFDLDSNVTSLINVIKNTKSNRFIYLSSGAVYDGLKGLVNPEVQLNPKLPYAISKMASEQYIKFFNKHGMIDEYVILRFFGAYGPYEPPRKIYTKLIKNFYLKKNNEFTIRGNGKNFIDAMYIEDAVKGITKVIMSDKQNLTVDFCSGTPLTINELVKKVARIFGIQTVKINKIGETAEYIEFYSSPAKMKQLFDFEPKMSLKRGLEKFVRFLEKEKKY